VSQTSGTPAPEGKSDALLFPKHDVLRNPIELFYLLCSPDINIIFSAAPHSHSLPGNNAIITEKPSPLQGFRPARARVFSDEGRARFFQGSATGLQAIEKITFETKIRGCYSNK
jgi:hypothetical protein